MLRYRRKQIGRSSVLIAMSSIVWSAYAFASQSFGALTSIVALALFGALFSSLTIEVDETEVRWTFAGRLWRRRILRADILEVREVRRGAWFGFGVAPVRGGWSYSVCGRKAVEVTLRGGRRILLGTDRPEQLAAALAA